MPSISINNLRFFDKSGSDISPIKTDNVWTSSLSIPEISVGLHEVAHIFIGEDVINTSNIITRNADTVLFSPVITFTNGTTKNVKPSMWIQGTNIPEGATIQSIKNQTQIFINSDLGAIGTGSTTLEMHPKRYELTYPRTNSSSKIRARLEQGSEIFYLFDVAYEETLPVINKVESFIFELDNGGNDSEIFNHREISSSEIRKELIQINIAASAKVEGEYNNILLIEEIDTDGTVTILSRVSLVFQAVGEDERFKSMLENFGRTIDSKEYIAFRNTDIKEDKINYQELNNKRKEMLVAGSEIWPYLGSYKGLVNALKYFGYGDLRLKEYWLNVDQNSKNEGKMITMNVPLSLDYTDKEFDQYKRFINGIAPNQPSKVFRKTAKFGLFYDLNRDTGEFDEDGLPITEDVFEFTNEEILIKLFSLKSILKEKFLPLNARIIDITGEGVYYDNIGINSWNIPTPTFHVDVEKELAFEANPKVGFLEDLSSQFTSNCDLYVSTKLSDKLESEVIDYSYCIIDEDVDEEGLPLVGKHPRYARKIGFQTTITNLTDDYVWNDLTMTWDESGEKTWENLKYQDYQTMRWIVKSSDRDLVIYDKTGNIGELDIITVTLPYLGFYDVTLELVDHFNFHHRQTKKNLIEVRPKEADIAAIFRSHEMYETWEEIEDTESDLAIGDMHGTWMDITINEDTTWTEVGDLTWEAVDWFTYSNQDKLFTYFDGEFVNQNSEEVANVIGFNPSKQEVRLKGLNNSRFFNNKRQSAYFFKDRTKSDVLLLDIVANAAGNPLSMREYNNNDVQFVNAKEGFIIGDLGKLIYTKDGGRNWDILKSDTVSNLNALSFVSASNGWIVGDYGVFLKYTQTISGIPKISVSFPTPGKNLYDVHFINEDIGYIAGDSVVWKTVDGGTVWGNIAPNSFTEIVNKIYFPTTTLGIFVTRSGKIYRTTDGGENWDIVLNVNYSITSLHFFDNLYGWASYTDGTNHKVLKTTDGGQTWEERFIPVPLSSIRFINRQIGFAAGLFTSPSKIGVVLKTQDGGKTWFILTNNTTDVVNKIYPLDSQIIYAVGLEGAILKTSNGGEGADKWVSQTANQKDGFPLGSEFNTWITEAYNGLIFQYEQAILVIKHTPRSLTWTGNNSLITKWTVGSTQSALDAKLIFFDTPEGRKQYSITSAKFTITNEVEYTIDQLIEDTSILNNGFIVQSLEAVEINNKPRNESGGLRIDWVNTWTNETVFVLDNMMIMLRLESKDMYCNILDMKFEDDETILSLDWRCDIIKKLDPDYYVAIKPYNIEEANTKMGTINRTWGSFCTDVTWEDMSNKTWNDFEFNGLSYCSFTINQVKRGGVIIVDDKHFFQFPPEEIKQLEGNLTQDDGYVTVGTYTFNAQIENGSVYVYVDDIKDLQVGMLVTGGGIQFETFIISIEDETPLHGKRFEMSKNATNTGDATVVCSIVNVLNLELGLLVHGDGVQPGSTITYLDGITPYYDNRFVMSLPATKTGASLLSFSSPNLSLQEAVNYLNSSDVEGIKDFYYSVPLLEDGITYADYILAKAKLPGVSALHYFEFLYGVESDWEDDPSHTHSYPLGIMKEWTKSEEDGGQPLGINNPPLWNYLYNTYYEFGEWFPVPELLGEYSSDIQDTRALYVQALDGTFNWQDTKIKRWKAKVNPGTTIFMNSFPSKIAGVTSHKWRLYDNLDTLLAEIDNEFLVWTFCDIGNYTVELEVFDIENNKYTVKRNGFIEVARPKKDNHYLPGLGWTPPELPELPPIEPPPYQEPNDGILKYYETFWILSGTNNDQTRGTLVVCNWESDEIRRAAVKAKEFFLEYINPDNSVSIIKYDITSGTDGSDLGNLFNYDATDPNFNFLENLNKNFNGAFNNPSKWLLPIYGDDELLVKLVDMQNNIRLRPDNRKRPPAKIYFIANSTSNM